MSNDDIEKLAREWVTIEETCGQSPNPPDAIALARAYLAERQRADDSADRERELRELVADLRSAVTTYVTALSVGRVLLPAHSPAMHAQEAMDLHKCRSLVQRADALLKEPQ